MAVRVELKNLGRMSYAEAWDYQQKLFDEMISVKSRNRDLPPDAQLPQKHYLLLVEHPHVYTLGKSGSMDNLLLNEDELKEKGIEFYKTNRGGDITYHGPGQIVGYPILDLDFFFTDIHRYMRMLEEIIILTLADYGIESSRLPGYTGTWLDPEDDARARKICAMGVKCSRWVTMHGWAFNVNADLSYFDHIIPCGISDKAVTSMEKELGRPVDMAEVQERLLVHFQEQFNCVLG